MNTFLSFQCCHLFIYLFTFVFIYFDNFIYLLTYLLACLLTCLLAYSAFYLFIVITAIDLQQYVALTLYCNVPLPPDYRSGDGHNEMFLAYRMWR